MRICTPIVLCLAVAGPALAQQQSPPHGDRDFLHTIVADVKSVVSEESASMLTVAAAFALLASPFDETLTYSASCSTFLKTTFGGWARVAGQEWALGGGALATYVIGRTLDRPKIAAGGGDGDPAALRIESRDPGVHRGGGHLGRAPASQLALSDRPDHGGRPRRAV